MNEELRTIVSVKISDFTSKMRRVQETLEDTDRKSKTASDSVDKVVDKKKDTTSKTVDIVNSKLKETEKNADRANKVMSNVDLSKYESVQAKLAKINSQLDEQRRKSEALHQERQSILEGTQTPASLKMMEKEFDTARMKIHEVDQAVAELNSRMNELRSKQRMSENAGSIEGAERYRSQVANLEAQEERLLASTEALEIKASSLREKMQAIRMNPALSTEAQSLADKIALADGRMESLGHSASAAQVQLDSMTGTSPGLETINQKLGRIERSTGRTSKAMNRLNRRFLMLIASKVFNLIFKSLQQGFEGAAKKSEQFKKSLDEVASGGRNISNAMVSAFSPLITIIAPWVTYVADKIRILMNRVAMFFAAISGQKTVLQATQALDSFGNSAEANAAKAQRALAGFDQITKLDMGGGAGSGSGSGSSSGTDAFEEIGVEESPLSKSVKGIIEKLSELKGPLKEFYKKYLEPIKEWAFDDGGIEKALSGIGKGLEWLKNNPWALAGIAGLTGLFVAGKAFGGLGGAGLLGGMLIPKLIVGGLTIMGTVAGFDALVGTNTFENAKQIKDAISDGFFTENQRRSTGLDFMDWLFTGHTNHQNADGSYTRIGSEDNLPGLISIGIELNRKLNHMLGRGDQFDREVDVLSQAFGFVFDRDQRSGENALDLVSNFASLYGDREPEEYRRALVRALSPYVEALDSLFVRGSRNGARFSVGRRTTMQSTDGQIYKGPDIPHSNITISSPGVVDVYGSYLPKTNVWKRAVDNMTGILKKSMMNANLDNLAFTKTTYRSIEDESRSMTSSLENSWIKMGRDWNKVNTGMTAGANSASTAVKNHWSSVVKSMEVSAANSETPWGRLSRNIPSLMKTAMDNSSSVLRSGSKSGSDGTDRNFKSMVSTTSGYLKTMMNNTRSSITASFNAFAALPASIRSAMGISIVGFKLPSSPKLPKFATGGIFNSPTAGIIGEAGREAVLPLDRNTGWMDQLLEKINTGTGTGSGDIYVTVQNTIDGQVISEKTTKIQRRTSRVYNRPILT